MKRVGILGGGQLGTMLGEAVARLGGHPRFFAHPGSTAHQRFSDVTLGHFRDATAVEAFVQGCDVVTFEMEHVPVDVLSGIPATYLPALDVIRTTQHRAREKRFLANHALPHAEFEFLPDSDALAALRTFPRIVKTCLGGYDGMGQRFIDNAAARDKMVRDVANAEDAGFVAEEPIAIEAELSCVVARGSDATSVAFPVVRNDHRFHVLDVSVTPTGLSAALEHAARQVAIDAAERLDVVGLLTVEFFVASQEPTGRALRIGDAWLLVNEFAPRPHNSGHLTRKSCSYSQFDALARVLLDIPLTAIDERTGAFAMANLLSEVWGRHDTLDLSPWSDFPSVEEVYLYGKNPNRARRKMGHVIAHGADATEAAREARRFRDAIQRP